MRYVLWHKKKAQIFQTGLSLADAIKSSTRHELVANPVDSTDTASPWMSLPPLAYSALKKILGKSPYAARAGLVTWADGVYWVEAKETRGDGLVLVSNLSEAGKRELPAVERYIECDYLYSFVRWEDIRKWLPTESHKIVLPHTKETGWRAVPPSEMKVHTPETYRYFKKFEKVLLNRSGYQQLRQGEPFYICSNTGPWLFSRYKVAWRTMAPPLQACVVSDALNKDGKPPMFKNTIVFVPVDRKDEAHYLCACINSSCVNLAAQSYSTGKSFGSPHLLQQVAIPEFNPKDVLHQRLSECSMAAHKIAIELTINPEDLAVQSKLREIESQINAAVAKLWGLQKEEVESVQSALTLIAHLPMVKKKPSRDEAVAESAQASLAISGG